MNRVTAPALRAEVLREAVDWAISSRRSVRAFLPTPVPSEEIEAILSTARYSASGMNMQPWRVHVLTGEAKTKLSAALAELDDSPEGSRDLQEPYDYYPRELLVGVPALHGVHVLMLEIGSIPPINSARPLSWSSLDRIAASGLLGKGAILGFDCLLIGAGLKLLFSTNRRSSNELNDKRRN